jgi:DNA-3-methyladenine glycosylase II
MSQSTLSLGPVPPFRLDLTVWTLRRRPDNAVDRWDGQTYRRVLPLPAGPVEVAVTQVGPPAAPRLRVAVAGEPLRSPVRAAVTAALERLLGLRIDLAGFYRFAARQRHLGPLARRFRGMKPPRFATVFEGLVNAIACQQVTLTLGIRLLNRLAAKYGATAGRFDPEELAALPDDEAVARLGALRGVGRWTAEYVLLRGLGRTNVFPGDDVGARNNLRRWLHLAEPLDYQGTRQTVARWQRYGGLVYFHLLLDRLEEAGYLEAGAPRQAGPGEKR